MKKTFTLFFALMVFFNFNAAFAQEEEAEESPLSLGADLVSRYVWRGVQLSASPAIQPSIEYSFGNFTVGTWGSYTFAHEDFQEVDLFLSYSINSFSITLNDYFLPGEVSGESNKYFDWNQDSTGHALELIGSWEGTETLPLTVTAGVFLYGDDKDANGNNRYSTYLEAAYGFDIQGVSLSPFAGITFADGMYSDGFALVNLGLKAEKEIEITEKYSLPISASFITNPDAGNIFLVVGFSF
jgi:hypothetical protein